MIAEVFRYRSMPDVSSDQWLFITSSLLFAGFGIHMFPSLHMEKSPSYCLQTTEMHCHWEDTGFQSGVVDSFFITNWFYESIHHFLIPGMKKCLWTNNCFFYFLLFSTSFRPIWVLSWKSRNTLGHRILGVFGFEDEEPGEADCMVCYERLRSDAWMMNTKTKLLRGPLVFLVLPPTIMKFDKYSRILQNTG